MVHSSRAFGLIIHKIIRTIRRKLGLQAMPKEHGVTWRITGAFVDNEQRPYLVGHEFASHDAVATGTHGRTSQSFSSGPRYTARRQHDQHPLYLVPKVSNRR